MITLEEIKRKYPYPASFDRSAFREYFQYKILDILFSNGLAGKIAFLGGTAIKICHGSNRFSEDLDFDNFGLTEAEFVKAGETIRDRLSLEGYEVEIKTVSKKALRCYVKISHVLFDNRLSPLSNEKFNIQIDTMPHNFVYTPEIFLLQKYEVFRRIAITPKDIVLSQKIAAVLGRKRAKGRDFYDIVYLRGITDFNYAYLTAKLGIRNSAELKQALKRAIKDLDFKALVKDVLPFLINPEDQSYVLDFARYIDQKL